MKKTRKKMILSATVLTALALFAGCTRANAASPAPTAARVAETQPAETKPAQTKSDRISAEKALSIALNHAGVTDARDRDVEGDDGRWEVCFEPGRTEYEYDISADGTILHWEKEIDD